MAAGFLIGLALTGAVTAPLRQRRLVRLTLTILVSMAAFAAVGPLGPTQYKPDQQIRDVLHDNMGATVKLAASVQPLVSADGIPAGDGVALPVALPSDYGTFTWLAVHNAARSFEFSPALTGLYACIDQIDGPMTYQVNGQTLGAGNISGITVSLGRCSSGTKVDIEGPIESFTVGGQDWRMERLCPTFAEPMRDCMDFEELHARRALLSDQFETWQLLLVGAICGLGFFLGLNREGSAWQAARND